MAILKYKLGDGWKILYQDFFEKIIRLCNGALQKEKNLEDLPDPEAARANLGLDGLYIEKTVTNDGDTLTQSLKFADNTWNKVGNDSMFGDKNIAGKFAIKSQDENYQTGIALVDRNSNDNSNYANINYTGTNVAVDKPFHATKGFVCDTVNEANLNDYLQSGFFKGKANTSSDIIPNGLLSGNTDDYSGISIGDAENGSGTNPRISQLLFDMQHIYFREWDIANGWESWKQLAFQSDIDEKIGAIADYAKKDASNVNATTWGQVLGTGAIVSGENRLVNGGAVYAETNAIKNNYAKKDASNLTAADITKWTTKLGTGSVADNNANLITGGEAYQYIQDQVSRLNTAIEESRSVKTQNTTQNGYIEFADGLALQWGKQLIGNDIRGGTIINFNQPFSSVYTVIANMQRVTEGSVGGSYTRHALNGEATTTGFRITANIESGGGSIYIHWIAIGTLMDP